MAEFRKWTLHFEDGNNLVEGKRVLDPPGFAAGGGKELVSLMLFHRMLLLRLRKSVFQPDHGS